MNLGGEEKIAEGFELRREKVKLAGLLFLRGLRMGGCAYFELGLLVVKSPFLVSLFI